MMKMVRVSLFHHRAQVDTFNGEDSRTRLMAALQDAERVVVVTHGYNVQYHQAIGVTQTVCRQLNAWVDADNRDPATVLMPVVWHGYENLMLIDGASYVAKETPAIEAGAKLAAFLSAQPRLSRVDLVGHSLGSLVISSCAKLLLAHRPELLRAGVQVHLGSALDATALSDPERYAESTWQSGRVFAPYSPGDEVLARLRPFGDIVRWATTLGQDPVSEAMGLVGARPTAGAAVPHHVISEEIAVDFHPRQWTDVPDGHPAFHFGHGDYFPAGSARQRMTPGQLSTLAYLQQCLFSSGQRPQFSRPGVDHSPH